MHFVIWLLLSAFLIYVTTYIVPGVRVSGFGTALLVALVLGLVNAFIRPILLILTLPINILTLGLFTFVIIALLVMLVSLIVPGFEVDGFWWAMLFGVILAIFNILFGLT